MDVSVLTKTLTIDERETVADLLRHEGFKPLLKVITALVDEQERSVLRLSSSEGADKLMQAKLKAEGARKLLIDIEQVAMKEKKAERAAAQKASSQRLK